MEMNASTDHTIKIYKISIRAIRLLHAIAAIEIAHQACLLGFRWCCSCFVLYLRNRIVLITGHRNVKTLCNRAGAPKMGWFSMCLWVHSGCTKLWKPTLLTKTVIRVLQVWTSTSSTEDFRGRRNWGILDSNVGSSGPGSYIHLGDFCCLSTSTKAKTWIKRSLKKHYGSVTSTLRSGKGHSLGKNFCKGSGRTLAVHCDALDLSPPFAQP